MIRSFLWIKGARMGGCFSLDPMLGGDRADGVVLGGIWSAIAVRAMAECFIGWALEYF